MKNRIYLFISVFFLSVNYVFSQNEGMNWFFGNKAGLNFATTPPTILTGSLNTSEGCSSISDASGNLLFYTDGITIYDKNHNVMTNGTGLFGDGSSTQSGVIVKQPGSTTMYYVFTVDDVAGPKGLSYSIVDMSLNSGLGAVTTKNVLLQSPSTEKVTGVKHCNGVDIWILSHDYNTNVFRTFLLTSAGVSSTPVLSAVGSVHGNNSSVCVGALKTSPNGKKLGVCISNGLNTIELYDFDNTTGVVSNFILLGTISGVYGCEFSPDGTKFYGAPWAGSKLYQWDLCAGTTSAAILASEYTVSCSNGGQLQLAPDGKIYMARAGQSSLGVFNNPNGLGASCNYVNNGQSIAPNTSQWGLPNFITSFLSAPFTYTQACSTVSFTPPPAPISATSGCSAAGNTITSMNWIFGDPGSGANNTSTQTNPIHTYGAAGTYTVKLIRTSNCGNDTIALPIVIVSSGTSFSAVPTVTQANCTSTLNAFNLNLTFNPPNPVPGYTITWNQIPNGVTSSTQTSSSNLFSGAYSATIAVDGGCSTVSNFTINPGLGTLQFSVLPSYEITCTNQTATVSVDPAYNYTWTSLSAGPFNGSTQVFGSQNVGTWTVTGANSGGCAATKTFAIVQNTITPTSTIGPLTQNITCSLSSVTTVTATSSPSVNVTQEITSPQGGVFTANSYSTIYVPGGTGTFTHCAINNVNGCKSCKTFTVTSSQGFPTFSVVSAGNFTLGCNTKSLITVNITNGSAAGGGPVSYTLLPPTSDGSTPSGTLSSNSTYTVNSPGTYTVVTKDNTSFCETRTPISILQNTFTPQINVNVNSYILSCNEPTVLLVGSSTTPKVSYNWSFPPTSGPGNVPEYSLSVAANTVNTTATLVANYTLTVTDDNNTCKSTTVVPVLQNLFRPKTVMSAGSPALSCKIPTIVLSNNSSTGIPPNTFPSPLPVIGYLWEGPTPQEDGQVRSTYLAATPGIYTLTGKDLNNGCTSTTVLTIGDNRIYPILNNPDSPPQSILDCGATATKLFPIVTNSANTSYSWTAPPTASVTGASSPTLSTNATGDYTVLVTNTVSGCASIAYMIVQPGTITAKFTADTTGYAPLDLRITNNSNSSLGNSGITSVWSFGNGTYSSTAASDPPVLTRYSLPGNYTITLFVLKGECADTIQKVIRVESHSGIEIPNIFTPNGDGANDVFFVKAKNLSEISIIIYDRWGHTVYELNSTTGNIAWDGLNQYGQKVAEGIYYYVLTAKGSDGEEFKNHGNITLMR